MLLEAFGITIPAKSPVRSPWEPHSAATNRDFTFAVFELNTRLMTRLRDVIVPVLSPAIMTPRAL